jgi:hypothetical protein
MYSLLSACIPVFILLFGLAVVAAAVSWWRWSSQHNARRSPLPHSFLFLRPPGQSIRQKIASIDTDIDVYGILLLVVPLVSYALHISQSYFGRATENGLRIGVSIILVVLFEVGMGRRLLLLLKERRKYALGLDGEMATAEELNQLMLDGCRVFHDIPISYGNVDHVVISHSGVYAVNTKMLCKPPTNDSNAYAIVDHTKNIIQFPDWVYPIPNNQLATEAKCLADKLTDAVGKQIEVEPMIALAWLVYQRTNWPQFRVRYQSQKAT